MLEHGVTTSVLVKGSLGVEAGVGAGRGGGLSVPVAGGAGPFYSEPTGVTEAGCWAEACLGLHLQPSLCRPTTSLLACLFACLLVG